MTTTDREVKRLEALDRALNGVSMGNYATILEGFVAKGIPLDDIKPRENVFTYAAWLAQGRQVRRGEHGVRIATVIPMEKTDEDSGERVSFRRPRATSVFHISQTDPVEDVKKSTAKMARTRTRGVRQERLAKMADYEYERDRQRW